MTQRPLRILLLGSTGSIGSNTCNCVRRFRNRFAITGLAAARNIDRMIEQIDEFAPSMAYIADSDGEKKLREKYGNSLTVFSGAEGLEELVKTADYDILFNALVGAIGLSPTVIALQQGKRVALANKESLVIGGDYIQSILAQGKGSLVPVDSEHSAILQCLPREKNNEIESIILTASGGPFRKLPKEKFASITVDEALKHPTWSMGKKITIDAATLMNKGFEVIEAHHLFSLPYSKLRVWIHPQSIIHSLVEFHDGAVMAQLGVPDMELPIQYALSFPQRLPMGGKRLSLPEIERLEFFHPDIDRFPCLALCCEAGEMGGTAPTVVNAANEVAVELFLQRKINFPSIAEIVTQALHSHSPVKADSLDVIRNIDRETREKIIHDTTTRGGL
jgi:1-deoxy-D-xylulose-5-phosphate reductoisomerase